MFGLNTFFTATNSRDYLDQLFTRNKSPNQNEAATPSWQPPSYDAETGTTAQDRALSKIISIIWDMDHAGADSQTSVSETNGYVLDATGTDGADTIKMQAVSAYSISAGEGDDTITVKAGSVGALDAGGGNDTVQIAADYSGAIDGGEGKDTIGIVGKIADDVTGGAGDDTIKISAKTILGASGGDGNDTLYLEGERIFASGGAGDDTITIHNKGNQAAELSFAAGDGKDTVNSSGALNIRFTPGSPGAANLSSYGPKDLDISVVNNKLVIHALKSDDALTINFDPGALAASKPSFSFELDNGNYVLKIR
jgi:hypothetical protein